MRAMVRRWELCWGLDMARQSVSHPYLNAAPIKEIAERWITQCEQHRVHALAT